MRIPVGERDGEELVIFVRNGSAGLMQGRRLAPTTGPIELVAILVAKIVLQARIAELAGRLENLPTTALLEVANAGRDVAVIRLPGGDFGIHIDGDQQEDVRTATAAARLAYGASDA